MEKCQFSYDHWSQASWAQPVFQYSLKSSILSSTSFPTITEVKHLELNQFSYNHWSQAPWAQPVFRWIKPSGKWQSSLYSNQGVKPTWWLRETWEIRPLRLTPESLRTKKKEISHPWWDLEACPFSIFFSFSFQSFYDYGICHRQYWHRMLWRLSHHPERRGRGKIGFFYKYWELKPD